ncbi:hypothetical protein P0Q10_08935, partial [Campylobacter jejuni]|uniref:hypothetical protein n=1 Tax=Campylobacter jejuni TaxID=197 RepID=UPI002F9663F9
TAKPTSANAGVGAKSKGTVKLKKKSGLERTLGAAAHLLYPKGEKPDKKGTGRLGAVGGNQLSLANSAPGIVLRS